MGEFGFPVEAPIVIYYDNQSAIQVFDNLVACSKINHVKPHVHYPRWLVHEHVVSLLYYKTDDQVVDIFMKSLSKAKFIKFQDLLGLQVSTIMGGCANAILPLESPKCSAGGGVLELAVMLVQHNYGSCRYIMFSCRLVEKLIEWSI